MPYREVKMPTDRKNALVSEIVNGERLIDLKVYRCDDEHWVVGIDGVSTSGPDRICEIRDGDEIIAAAIHQLYPSVPKYKLDEVIHKSLEMQRRPYAEQKVRLLELCDYASKINAEEIEQQTARDKVFDEAKRTGEPQLLRSEGTEMDEDDNSFGVIGVYIRPDGTVFRKVINRAY